MSDIFIKFINMSLTASIVALVVMLVRFFLRKMPKIYSYALWAVVFLRLVCPFTIQLPANDNPVQMQTIPQDIISYETPSYTGTNIMNDVEESTSQVNIANDTDITSSTRTNLSSTQWLLKIAAYVWILGVIVLILLSIISYLRLKNRVQSAIRVRDNIFETDRKTTPFVLGFIHPRIYIPLGLNPQEYEYVIKHEQMHIKRFDYIIKPIAFMITAVHWFNPIIWLSYSLMTSDMELSADEGVIKQLGTGIRAGYSNTLLALSIKKAGIFSPLAFGETKVKRRVKNVLNFKKPKILVSIAAIIIVVLASIYLISGTQSDEVNEQTDSGINITYASDFMGFKTKNQFDTTDSKIVSYINSVTQAGEIISEPEDLEGNNINEYKIESYNESGQYTCTLYYDTLYHRAYLEKDDRFVEVDLDFARYVDSLLENEIVSTNINKDVASLFGDYGWTLDYQIDILDYKLNDIKVLSETDANAYYFAYNNELSKDIGLDMSEYSNSNIEAEIYRIRESMPDEFYPIQDCRGIVIKYNSEIIGAFISAGRHSAFSACSLKGNSFHTTTGKTVSEWLPEVVEPGSGEEIVINLEPKEVLEKYFSALNEKDTTTAAYCVSRESILQGLTSNMLNDQLYNEELDLPFWIDYRIAPYGSHLQSVELISIEPFDDIGDGLDTDIERCFAVDINLQYENDEDSSISGIQYYNCYMVYESPQTGWKITSFGMG